MTAGGDWGGQLDDKEETVAVVALERQGLAVVTFDFFDDEVRVQLDADAAGGFHGLEVDLCGSGDGLPDGVD
jgi:hypothetical protein